MAKNKQKKVLAIAEGLIARATGQPYHTNSGEERSVYHTRKDCPDGLAITRTHIREGTGRDRSLCAKCAELNAAPRRRSRPAAD